MNGTREGQDSARAFTLMELMVALAIIGLLFMLIIPAAQKSVEIGRATACTSQLRQLAGGLNAYLAEHELTMPTMKAARASVKESGPVLDTVLLPYLRDPKAFACPSDSKHARLTGTSYFWNSTINGQRLGSLDFMKLTSEASRIPIMSDKDQFHPYLERKVNVLYADGHATKDLKFITDEETAPK